MKLTLSNIDGLPVIKECFWSSCASQNHAIFSSFKGENPESIDFNPPTLEDGSRINLPVLVMASNRPQYLFRMLKSLQGVQGLNPAMVTVFVDGFFDEPASVARMFGLRVNQHEGVSKRNSRICQVCISYGYKGRKLVAMKSQLHNRDIGDEFIRFEIKII